MKYLPILLALFLSPSTYTQIVIGGGLVEVSACDFEEVCTWLEMDTAASNQWQMGLPEKPFFDTAYSAPNCIMTDSVLPYAPSNNSSFIVPLFDDEGLMFNHGIRFWHKYQSDSLLDGGYIEFSYDYGET